MQLQQRVSGLAPWLQEFIVTGTRVLVFLVPMIGTLALFTYLGSQASPGQGPNKRMVTLALLAVGLGIAAVVSLIRSIILTIMAAAQRTTSWQRAEAKAQAGIAALEQARAAAAAPQAPPTA